MPVRTVVIAWRPHVYIRTSGLVRASGWFARPGWFAPCISARPFGRPLPELPWGRGEFPVCACRATARSHGAFGALGASSSPRASMARLRRHHHGNWHLYPTLRSCSGSCSSAGRAEVTWSSAPYLGCAWIPAKGRRAMILPEWACALRIWVSQGPVGIEPTGVGLNDPGPVEAGRTQLGLSLGLSAGSGWSVKTVDRPLRTPWSGGRRLFRETTQDVSRETLRARPQLERRIGARKFKASTFHSEVLCQAG